MNTNRQCYNAYQKVVKVIESCTNLYHANVALKLVGLFIKQFPDEELKCSLLLEKCYLKIRSFPPNLKFYE